MAEPTKRERVTSEDLDTAIAWLEVNEGDQGEAESCRRVAAWLRAEMERRDLDNMIRQAARERGIKPAQIRAHLRSRKGTSGA